MLECHKRRDISQTNIKHLTFYLPFGCTQVKQELIPNPIPNSKIPKFIQDTRIAIFSENAQSESMYKYSQMREGNKVHVYSIESERH